MSGIAEDYWLTSDAIYGVPTKWWVDMVCKNRAVIISGGEIRDYSYIKSLIKETDLVICADSGYDHALKMGITPDFVVGDFDSAQNVPPKEITLTFPSKKDFTDTELALETARERGFKNMLFLAATGNRIDHSLANVLLLKSCAEREETASIVNENNAAFLIERRTNKKPEVRKNIKLAVEVAQVVSLLPLENCEGVTTQNLEYALTNATLRVGTTRGISNVATSNFINVSIESGCLLVVLAKD